MSWRDRLKEAKYNDIPFYVKKSNLTVGRRTKLYESYGYTKTGKSKTVTTYGKTYSSTGQNIDSDPSIQSTGSAFFTEKKTRVIPGRKSYHTKSARVVDLGKKAREYEIEGYIVQNKENNYDYFTDKEKLISALEKKGNGVLVHPYYGIRKVNLISVSKFTEDIKEGGIVRFTLKFSDFSISEIKTVAPNYKKIMDLQNVKSEVTLSDKFVKAFNATSEFVQNSLDDVTSAMNSVQSVIYSVKGAVSSTISKSLGLVSSSIATLETTINSPCDLWGSMKSGVSALDELVGLGSDVVQGGIIGGCSGVRSGNVITLTGESIPYDLGNSVCRGIIEVMNQGADGLQLSTSSDSENRAVALDGFCSLMAMKLITIAIRIEFSSQQELLILRESIVDVLDSCMNKTDDFVVFQELNTLRSNYADHSINQSIELAKEITYEIPGRIKTLLELSYDRYGDLSRDKEILKRNNLKNPNFINKRELVLLDE